MTVSKPLYHRFVISPTTGTITLANHLEGHPADSRYHGQLAQELNEPNLIHGYAHRLSDGWRLLDYESKPFTDPWIIKQVNDRLAQEQPQAVNKPSWGEMPSFKSFHYGSPVETTRSS